MTYSSFIREGTLLHKTLDNIFQWTIRTGFKLWPFKSKIIKIVDHHKLLGVVFDKRLTWKHHIQETKDELPKIFG